MGHVAEFCTTVTSGQSLIREGACAKAFAPNSDLKFVRAAGCAEASVVGIRK